MRRALALAAVLSPGVVALNATAATAQVPSAPLIAAARLTGQFSLAARVTVAHNVKGERVGDQAGRTWMFTPLCPAGACATIQLVRQRAAGKDTLTLHQRAAGDYAGAGLFYAPLRCAGRTYTRGESVPFTIEVHVTAAALILGVDVATRISATYTNLARKNLTRCVEVPGHDAAAYHGHLVSSASGGAGVVSDRSPAGS